MFVFNQLNIQEVVVETSGVGADRDIGGMQLNMIRKDGGNIFSGSATLRLRRPEPGESNINDELLARGARPAAGRRRSRSSGTRRRRRRPDQAGPAVVLRRGARGRDAAVRRRRVLEQAARSRQSLLYEPDIEPAGVHQRLLEGCQRSASRGRPRRSTRSCVASSFQPNCNCVFNLLTTGVAAHARSGRAAPVQPELHADRVLDVSRPRAASCSKPGVSAQIVNQNDKREPGFGRDEHTGSPTRGST